MDATNKQLAIDLLTVAAEYTPILGQQFEQMARKDGFAADRVQFCALHSMVAGIFASSGLVATAQLLGVDMARDMRNILIQQLQELKL